MQLEEARQIIDRVNMEFVPLIEQRMDAVVEVTRYKREHGLPVYDEAREQAVLDKVSARVQNKDYEESVRKVFQAIMDVAKEYEESHL